MLRFRRGVDDVRRRFLRARLIISEACKSGFPVNRLCANIKTPRSTPAAAVDVAHESLYMASAIKIKSGTCRCSDKRA